MEKKNLYTEFDNNSSSSDAELSKFKQRLANARIKKSMVTEKDVITSHDDKLNKGKTKDKNSLDGIIQVTNGISDIKKNSCNKDLIDDNKVLEKNSKAVKISDTSENSVEIKKNLSDIRTRDIVTSDKENNILSKRKSDALNDEFTLKQTNVEKRNVSDERSVSYKNKNVKKNKSKCVGIIKRKDISNLSDDEKVSRLDELEKKILLELDTKIKRELDELNNIVNDNNDLVEKFRSDEVVSLDEVKERYDKLNELLKKITKLIEQANILNDNYKFEDILNLTDFEDQNIVNDIIEFRDLLDTSEHSKKLTDKYKMLDSFMLLYREVYIKEEVLKNNISVANDKVEKTEKRDKKYSELQEDMEVVSQIDSDCKLLINKQNEYLDVLRGRINNISSNRVVEYRMRGINDMLSSMLLYLGIMVGMPFKNNKVSAGAKALTMGLMLRNLRRSRPRTVAVERLHYEADDFSEELFSRLSDVEVTMSVINTVLDDVIKMKDEFDEEFYNKVPGYENVRVKLIELESSVRDSKKKLEETSEKLKTNVNINNKKLVRVKELNEGSV